MENPICDIQVLHSPNRKYASTVNLVFFRAYPLYKNFQIYVDGLKKWKEYKKYYPDCQLQIFIDQSIVEDESILAIINSLDARVFVVKCPEFLKEGKYHIGIFPTFWRFFPGFDIFKHPFKIAHSQELEPDDTDIIWFKRMDLVSKLKYPKLGFVHFNNKVFQFGLNTNEKIENIMSYPQVFGGRVTFCNQAPFEIMVNFFEKVNRGDKILKIYKNVKNKVEHEKYSFGIDETFLNTDYQDWMIKNGYAIGIMTGFRISYAIYYLKDRILQDSRSKHIMDYILQKKQSLKESLNEIDKLYYKYPANIEFINECTTRFYEIIDKYPNWLSKEATFLLQKVFYGYAVRNCIIMVRNNKIENIIDVNID